MPAWRSKVTSLDARPLPTAARAPTRQPRRRLRRVRWRGISPARLSLLIGKRVQVTGAFQDREQDDYGQSLPPRFGQRLFKKRPAPTALGCS